jgi:hypothetical protein
MGSIRMNLARQPPRAEWRAGTFACRPLPQLRQIARSPGRRARRRLAGAGKTRQGPLTLLANAPMRP